MRHTWTRPWSVTSTLLTALGCVALLGSITSDRRWLTITGAVLLTAAALTNVIDIVQTRRTATDARTDDHPA